MEEMITLWVHTYIDVIITSILGGIAYFLWSKERPTKKKLASAVIGVIIALVCAPPITEYLDYVKYDALIAFFISVSGRWVLESGLEIRDKLKKDKFGGSE